MPDPGQEQLRERRSVDYDLERTTLQKKMNELIAERNKLNKAGSSLEKQLIAANDKLLERMEKQKSLSERMQDRQRAFSRATDPERKKTYEAQFLAAKKRLETATTAAEIEKIHVAEAKRMLALEQQIAEEQAKSAEAQIDATLMQLSKFGSFFGYAQKWFSYLKKFNNLTFEARLAWAGIAAVLSEAIRLFLEIDKATSDFRIEMGLLRTDASRVTTEALEIAKSFAGVGVTMKGVLNATAALAQEFGGTMKVSKNLVETTALLKTQLGVAEESSAGFFRNMAALSKTTAQAQRQMAFVASRLSAAAGVPLNMVMQDVAKMSGNALAMVSRMPEKIVKTAVAARELGTTINKMADGSRSILNFTENVQAEMEASVLIGESINLQLARELAYRRDIEGSTREILKIAKKIDFENLDVFQMEAFAAATGRSADEIMKMIQAQRQMNEARNIEGLKDEVALYDRLKNSRESALKDEALQREMTVKQMANQERIAALQQQWNQLIMEATAALFPLIDGLLKVAIVLVKIGPIVASFGSLLAKMGAFTTIIEKVGQFFGWVGKMVPFLAKIFSVFGAASKFLAPFLKVVPVLGWVILAFQTIAALVEHFDLSAPFWGLDKVIDQVLFKPFRDAWAWITQWFGGNSPSRLGLSIVEGLVSVGGMIFDALTYPFRTFLAWALDKIPFMGGLAEKVRGGIGGITNPTTVNTVGPSGEKKVETESAPEEKAQMESDTATLQEILKAVNTLNSNLISGKVAVYMDGQLLSTTLARQTAFKGGYGTNQVNVAG